MRNKGAITLFAILFSLVSLYQLSFTWVTSQVENDAEAYAQGDKNKEIKYLDSISEKGVYNFLWIKDFTYRECQEREINLGLDLKGGMNVTLEVSVIDLIRSMAVNSSDKTLTATIARAIELQKDSQEDFVVLFGQAFEEVAPGSSMSALFLTPELKDRIVYETSNEDVLKILQKEAGDAIDNSFNILRSRIDRFGVTQPNIQRLETSGRILVELPGVKDPERVRKLLQGTANLEFWETYDNQEVVNFLAQANTRLREMQAGDNEQKDETAATDSTQVETPDAGEETNLETDSLTQDSTEKTLLEKIEQDSTANQTQTLDDFKKQNPLWSVLRPSLNEQNQAYPGATVGTAHYRDTAQVRKYLNMKQIKDIFPRDMKFLWEVKSIEDRDKKPTGVYRLIALKITNRDGKAALEGDVITNARADFGQNQATAEVSMSMNGEGAKAWARLTKENINKQIAIVLDNYVYSAPNVNSEIKNGNSQITGNFSIAEAKDLANILKSGKLPAPARILQEEVVGPSLGQESIDKGFMSFAIAFLLVLAYMIFYYNRAGIVADIALITNIFFIAGVLASLGAVLTLPGIAGIVLTIGMSVDANVLIYERIREELATGKGIRLAIKDGYNNAYSAIIDANVTTLLTGIILYVFGTGPIKGFATTLVIGIFTSLFAAIFITRLIYIYMLDKEIKPTFATKFTKNAFKNLNIDFLGKRKMYYIISGVVILLGLISLVTRGLNQGIDFKGGRTYIVKFDEDVNTSDIQSYLKEKFEHTPSVVTFGGNDQVKITTTYKIDSTGTHIDEEIEQLMYDGLKPILGDISLDTFLQDHRQSSMKVGPTIADDIKVSAAWAIFLSLIIIFLYIFVRFSNWQFGLGALAALLHDVLIVLALFSMFYGILPFSMEIDQAFIAAILTVIGYSINDTVVVFDRIREYMGIFHRKERSVIYNDALNSTLSRTFSTSLSTFIVLLAIFLFGGEVIRGFVFALLVGVVVGTYSSLFIATPVVFDTVKQIEKRTESIQEKRKAKRKK